MRYSQIKQLSCEEFCRLTGVNPQTFEVMLGILRIEDAKKRDTWWSPQQTFVAG